MYAFFANYITRDLIISRIILLIWTKTSSSVEKQNCQLEKNDKNTYISGIDVHANTSLF
jgi:hypothetical protein